jgi:glyoxylase-like metal-dependent hydrolase (beta-lactamase superfamily II)
VEALDRLIAFKPRLIVPGHGPASSSAEADLRLTRDYLLHLRQTMGEAARNLEPFEDAYAKADWSRFEHLPLFKAANRINAYNTYLLMEQDK